VELLDQEIASFVAHQWTELPSGLGSGGATYFFNQVADMCA
jgi:hypothetical protein